MKNQLFGWLFASPLKTHAEETIKTSPDRLHETYAQIDQGLEELRAQHSLGQETDFLEMVRLAEQEKSQHARQLQEQESHNSMKSDVEGLHQQLGTGLPPLQCSQLQQALDIHFLENDDSQALEDRIDRHVLQFVFDQTGPLAWQEYFGLQSKGDAKLQARASTLEARALAMSPYQTRHLISGVVPVWKHAYPEREGDLWLDTALLGVYSAVRARLLLRAIELWFQRDKELDERLSTTLNEYLKEVRSLSKARGELEDVAVLTLELDEACRKVIPELVWTHIVSKLSAEPAPAAADSVVDPVCGMKLQPGQAAATIEVAQTTYYFCHRSCKDRFEKDEKKYTAGPADSPPKTEADASAAGATSS